MTGVQLPSTDYSTVLIVLATVAKAIPTSEVAKRLGISHDVALTRLHAATADGAVERLEEQIGRGGWRYMWRLVR